MIKRRDIFILTIKQVNNKVFPADGSAVYLSKIVDGNHKWIINAKIKNKISKPISKLKVKTVKKYLAIFYYFLIFDF